MENPIIRMHWWFVVGRLVPWLIAAGTVSAFFAMIWLVSDRFPIPQNIYGIVRNGLFALILGSGPIDHLLAA